MITRYFPMLGVAAALAAIGTSALAADSTERTSMPDFCSQRDVNCVAPDNTAAPRIVPPAAAGAASPATGVTVPSVPALPGQVPTLMTGGTSTGTTSSTSSGKATVTTATGGTTSGSAERAATGGGNRR